MFNLLRSIVAFLLCFLLGCLLSPVWAGAMGSIDDDEWYRRANHKIMVLRFDSPQQQQWGTQLAQLLSNYTLASMQGVNSLAVFSLGHADEAFALNQRLIASRAQLQRAPVVIWGSFYTHEDNIFVHPHISLFPKEAHGGFWQDIHLDIAGWEVPGVSRIVATLPTHHINFAPIEMDESTLQQMGVLQDQAFTLRAQPQPDARATGRLNFNVPYYVMETRGEWTRFLMREQGEGWAKMSTVFNQPQFDALKAVSLYAQGLLQFIARNDVAAIQTFDQYFKRYSNQQDAINLGTAQLILGCSYYRLGLEQGHAMMKQSEYAFEQAAQLLPLNAAPTNCQTLVTFWKIKQGICTPEDVYALEKALIELIQTTADGDAIDNLKALYSHPKLADAYTLEKNSLEKKVASRLLLLSEIEQQFTQESLSRR